MYKKLKSEKPNSHKYITIKTNLKTYNTILKRSIRLAKIDFYHSHFDKYKNDAPKTWSLINSIMNRTKKNTKQSKWHPTQWPTTDSKRIQFIFWQYRAKLSRKNKNPKALKSQRIPQRKIYKHIWFHKSRRTGGKLHHRPSITKDQLWFWRNIHNFIETMQKSNFQAFANNY